MIALHRPGRCGVSAVSGRRRNQRPILPRPIAVGLVLVFALATGSIASAHEGHDHDAPAPGSAGPVAGPGAGALPRRLPDGTLILPKASQRLVGLRTTRVEQGTSSRAVELPGQVVIEPDAAGRVQSTVAGRIEAGPRGLPSIGQAVVRGQVLATVRPSIDPVARAGQAALLAELEASRSLAVNRIARLRTLADTVPRKDIEAAESELASLEGRLQALRDGIAASEPLRAPVSGVIARTEVVAGQVVDARELVFEIVDPARLRVEATGLDLSLAGRFADATVAVGGRAVPLAFSGAGRVLREQAVTLVFRAKSGSLASLAVGQPVAVTVRLGDAASGVAVPASALVRSAANEPMVWIKTQPERFEPRRVRTEPLDAARVRVVQGLSGGEHLVTEGAALLGQYR